MHTFMTDNVIFHYNSDFSGNVIVTDKKSLLGDTMEIPAQDFLKFVADAYVRPKLITCIEQTPAEDLLINLINQD